MSSVREKYDVKESFIEVIRWLEKILYNKEIFIEIYFFYEGIIILLFFS